jgi:hypothetical protein
MSEHFWLKLKHGAPSNPKWRMIAQKVGCPQGEVWTLYSWALDFAGQHEGSLAGFDLEEVAATTDYLLAELERIWAAFVDKAIVAGEHIHNWAKHQGQAAVAAAHAAGAQFKRAASAGAERVRRHRKRRRAAEGQGELFADASQAPLHPPVTNVTSEQNQPVEALHRSVTGGVTMPSPPSPHIESDSDLESPRDSPLPPTRWGARQFRRQEGTNPRALGTNPRAQRGLLLPFAGSRDRDRDKLAELIDRCARERQAGEFDDERFPQHLARIKARQAELFSNREAA